MNKEEKLKFVINDIVVYHPFKTDSFYRARVIDIKEENDKPYLLHLNGAENLWAYPIEVQSIEETYSTGKQSESKEILDNIDNFFKTASEKELTEVNDAFTIKIKDDITLEEYIKEFGRSFKMKTLEESLPGATK